MLLHTLPNALYATLVLETLPCQGRPVPLSPPAGVTTDLIARMGQDSPRARLIYQHVSQRGEWSIAVKVSAVIRRNISRTHVGDVRDAGCHTMFDQQACSDRGARYGTAMTELHIFIRERLTAARVSECVSATVGLISVAEDAEVGRDREPKDRSEWEFSQLELGSLALTVRPLEARGGADQPTLDRVPQRLVDGFELVEQSVALPQRWDIRTAKQARRLIRSLSPSPDASMSVSFVNGHAPRQVVVTSQASANLAEATKTRKVSLGSLTGRLQSVSTRGRPKAGLWTDVENRRVKVDLRKEDIASVAEWLDHHVRVYGELSRNVDGTPLTIKAHRITPAEQQVRLAETAGIAAGALGEMSPREYLEAVGGWA